MLTLGIETSGMSGTVALRAEGRTLQEVELSRSGRRHARTLVSELKSLCLAHSLQPRDVDVVSVSIGPGSFTGLRVGIVCARTFAYAIGCHIVGIDTLEAIASAVPIDMLPLGSPAESKPSSSPVQTLDAIVNAFRGELFVKSFVQSPSLNWEPLGETRIVTVADYLQTRPVDRPISGPGIEVILADLSPAERETLPTLPESLWSPSASIIAQLGEEAAQQGRVDDLWSLQPNYLRRSAAEEQAAARAATQTST